MKNIIAYQATFGRLTLPSKEYNRCMENNNNSAGIIGVIVVLLVIVIGAGTYLYYDKAEAPSQKNMADDTEQPVVASSCGLTIDSPKIGDNVSFPLTVTGRVDNTKAGAEGCSWTMFEGQAGVATLHYETKDGYSLPVDTKPVTVANWMTTSTTFSFVLNFDNSMLQLPAGYNMKIILTEENPSGEGIPSTVEVPVVLQ
jgi:hypothetical protein